MTVSDSQAPLAEPRKAANPAVTATEPSSPVGGTSMGRVQEQGTNCNQAANSSLVGVKLKPHIPPQPLLTEKGVNGLVTPCEHAPSSSSRAKLNGNNVDP